MNLNPFEAIKSVDIERKESTWDYDYSDLVKSISEKVNWTVEAGFNDYQGDFFFLGEDSENNIYFLPFGYGSCSGCDALQGCDSYEEIVELRDDLKRNVRQFKDINDFVTWFNGQGRFEWWSREDIEDFIGQVKQKYEVQLEWQR